MHEQTTRLLVGLILLGWFVALSPLAAQSWTPLDIYGEGRAVVHDTTRGRIMAVDADGTTWSWRRRWTALDRNGPVSTDNTSDAVYDSVRDRVVWFDSVSGETWEFDGSAWSARSLSSLITPRVGFALGFDPVRGRTVLHGGGASFLVPGSGPDAERETWEWDGMSWALVDVTSPPFRDHLIEFDPISNRLLLYVPVDPASATPRTFAWSGSGWVDLTPAQSPTRGKAAATLHMAEGRVWLAVDEFSDRVSLWSWDGSTWVVRSISNLGASRFDHLEFDIVRNGFVALSRNESRGWFWNAVWTMEPGQPIAVFESAMTDDRGRGRLVILGHGLGEFGSTWEWDGHTLIWKSTPNRPRRRGASLDYDSWRGVSLMFGGLSTSTGFPANRNLWQWDGSTWSVADPGTGPSTRFHHAAAFDDARGELVLFGGRGNPGTEDETWTWNGTQWSLRAPSRSPSPRRGHSMAYDSHRERVVLFGGETTQFPFVANSETWEWDGTTWELKTPPTSPAARAFHSSAYDPTRRRVLVHGGTPHDGGFTWEWDGVRWARLQGFSLNGLEDRAMAYSSADRRVLLTAFPLHTLSDTRVATRCAGLPRLELENARPQLGESTTIVLESLPTTGFLLNLVGFEPATPAIPLAGLSSPSCEFAIGDPLLASIVILGVSAPAGRFEWSLQIPSTPNALGVRLLTQSFVQASGPTLFTGTNAGMILVSPPPPTPLGIEAVTPLPPTPGQVVTVTGSGFLASSLVRIGDVPISATVASSTTFTFTLPDLLPCDGFLIVSNPNGDAVITRLDLDLRIQQIQGATGPAAGGGQLSLGGSGFVAGTTATIGGSPATIVELAPNLMTLIAPPGTIGPAEVVVTTPSGCVATTTYTYL